VARRDLPFEFMLNALRLTQGVPASLFAERTGLPLSMAAEPIAEAVRRGLLDPDPTFLRPTALGRRFLNDLQGLFLPGGREISAKAGSMTALVREPAVRP